MNRRAFLAALPFLKTAARALVRLRPVPAAPVVPAFTEAEKLAWMTEVGLEPMWPVRQSLELHSIEMTKAYLFPAEPDDDDEEDW